MCFFEAFDFSRIIFKNEERKNKLTHPIMMLVRSSTINYRDRFSRLLVITGSCSSNWSRIREIKKNILSAKTFPNEWINLSEDFSVDRAILLSIFRKCYIQNDWIHIYILCWSWFFNITLFVSLQCQICRKRIYS